MSEHFNAWLTMSMHCHAGLSLDSPGGVGEVLAAIGDRGGTDAADIDTT